MRMRTTQNCPCMLPTLILGACMRNPMDTPVSVGPTHLLYASHVAYPARPGEVRGSSEIEFRMTGLPTPRESQRLLTLAGTNRVD